MQQKLPQSWIVPNSDSSGEESQYSEEEEVGVRKTLLQWTRVKSLNQMKSARLTTFDIEKDLAQDKAIQGVRQWIDASPTQLLFDPVTFKGGSEPYALDQFKLTESQLFDFAKIATKLRRRFLEDWENLQSKKHDDLLTDPQTRPDFEMCLKRKYARSKDSYVHKKVCAGFERSLCFNKRAVRRLPCLGIDD